jgi:hypothetical protein
MIRPRKVALLAALACLSLIVACGDDDPGSGDDEGSDDRVTVQGR